MASNTLSFADETACWRYLIRKRWPDGARCPHCQRPMGFKKNRFVFQCPRCAKQLSATSGTIFHKSRLPLYTWFQAMSLILLSPKGISALQLQKRLGLRSYRAAWLLAHKIRAVMAVQEKGLVSDEAQQNPRFVSRYRAFPEDGARNASVRRSGVSHGWSSKYHHAYTAEFSYRARAGKDVRAAFEHLLEACLAKPHVALRDIKA